jgi:Type IV secretion system pilin
MKKTLLKLSALALLAAPSLAAAQSIGGILGLLAQANDLINRLIPFVIAITVLVFLWGIFKFVISAGDAEGRKEAQGYIIWGVVALFVMVSVWGLVNILVRSVNLDNTAPPAPGLPNPGGYFQATN